MPPDRNDGMAGAQFLSMTLENGAKTRRKVSIAAYYCGGMDGFVASFRMPNEHEAERALSCFGADALARQASSSA